MGAETTTRASLADAVHRKIGLSRTESAAMVDLFFDEISNALEKGDTVKLANFGTFKLLEKEARIGRNPRTREPAIIKPRKVISFSASPKLRVIVDQGVQVLRQISVQS